MPRGCWLRTSSRPRAASRRRRTTPRSTLRVTPPEEALRDDQWKIYQLVVRRFLATLSGPAKTLRTTLRFDSGGEPLTTSGTVVTEEGWLGVYYYGRRADEELPALNEGDEVDVVEAEVLGKETQPPGRYGQGRLIKLMEDFGLGTKATRPNIIQNLYDRGYVHDDPLIPTEKGIALARALKDFASEIASHEMTSELENQHGRHLEGKTSKENVVTSRATYCAASTRT